MEVESKRDNYCATQKIISGESWYIMYIMKYIYYESRATKKDTGIVILKV